MKKLLLSSIVLFLFSASGLIFQLSCSKEAKAENTLTQSDGLKQLGKILYNVSDGEYWLMNYDGTGKRKLNVPLPSGYDSLSEVVLSPDGQRVFLLAYKNLHSNQEPRDMVSIFSCKLDGSDLKNLVETNNYSLDLSVY